MAKAAAAWRPYRNTVVGRGSTSTQGQALANAPGTSPVCSSGATKVDLQDLALTTDLASVSAAHVAFVSAVLALYCDKSDASLSSSLDAWRHGRHH